MHVILNELTVSSQRVCGEFAIFTAAQKFLGDALCGLERLENGAFHVEVINMYDGLEVSVEGLILAVQESMAVYGEWISEKSKTWV